MNENFFYDVEDFFWKDYTKFQTWDTQDIISKNELGHMALAFNGMMNSLNGFFFQLKSSYPSQMG